jgi:hypothetical protein
MNRIEIINRIGIFSRAAIGALGLSFSLMSILLFADRSIAQLATWTGNGDGVSYSDPANWSGGVVPINSGGSNFNVLVPNNANINFNVSGSISGISYGTGGSITVATGVNFNVNSIASLGSNITANGANTSFMANGVGVSLGNISTVASNGAHVSTSANNYTVTDGGGTAFHANGIGTMVAASNMTTIANTDGSIGIGREATFLAENGGVVDFSNVQSIDGGSGGQVLGHRNIFSIRTGGMMHFDSLQTVSQYNIFNIEIGHYALPQLTTFQGSSLNISQGTSLDTPSLLEIADSTLSIPVGAELNASNLTSFRNSSLTLQPGVGFNSGTLAVVDNSRINVFGGSTITLGANSFNQTLHADTTAFSADGVGSQINAPQMTSIANTNSSLLSGAAVSFIAQNNGVINFGNVQTIDGGSGGQVLGHRNVFTIRTNGNINLNNLQSMTQRNIFNIEISSFSLPSLATSDSASFNLSVGTLLETPVLTSFTGGFGTSATIPIFATWNAEQLTTLNDTNLSLNVGGTLNAPNLTTLRNSTVTLQPGVGFNSGTLTDVDNSRISVLGGATIALGVSSFTQTLHADTTAFSANGVSSQINAPQMTSIANTNSSLLSGAAVSFIAQNSGVINFGNVQTIDGGSGGQVLGHRNVFAAVSGGRMEFGQVLNISERNLFTIDSPNSAISFKGLSLGGDNLTTFQGTNLGRLELSGICPIITLSKPVSILTMVGLHLSILLWLNLSWPEKIGACRSTGSGILAFSKCESERTQQSCWPIVLTMATEPGACLKFNIC